MKSEQFWRNKVNISKSGNFLSHFYARIEHRLERGFQKSEDQAGLGSLQVGSIHGKRRSNEPCVDSRGQVVDLDPTLFSPEDNPGQFIRCTEEMLFGVGAPLNGTGEGNFRCSRDDEPESF